MSLFKRLSATIFSRVDEAVSQIENHDAVIEAAIRDTRKAVARAKVRVGRVRGEGEQIRQRLAGLRQDAENWAARARSMGETDEAGALECLRRRRACLSRAGELESALTRHTDAEQQLVKDVEQLETRLQNISEQRSVMRTRESAAEAMRIINAMGDAAYVDIDDTLERWEVRVTEAEFAAGRFDPGDSFEKAFIDNEQREDLRAELKAMLAEEK